MKRLMLLIVFVLSVIVAHSMNLEERLQLPKWEAGSTKEIAIAKKYFKLDSGISFKKGETILIEIKRDYVTHKEYIIIFDFIGEPNTKGYKLHDNIIRIEHVKCKHKHFINTDYSL